MYAPFLLADVMKVPGTSTRSDRGDYQAKSAWHLAR
jgi:hypothetical protein